MKASICPVCIGRGLVSSGFYLSVGVGSWSSSSTTPETCKSCEGKGIVFDPCNDADVPAIILLTEILEYDLRTLNQRGMSALDVNLSDKIRKYLSSFTEREQQPKD